MDKSIIIMGSANGMTYIFWVEKYLQIKHFANE